MTTQSARMDASRALLARLEKGGKARPFWICGPCVIESKELVATVAKSLVEIQEKLGMEVVFKASFDKANRASVDSPRGVGIDQGLEILAWVKKEFGFPLLTDVHETTQVSAVAEVVDVLQIPAFLCRQTDLVEAVSQSGRLANVKKGQFLAPGQVGTLIQKLEKFGSPGFWITERGAAFGYGRLVVDFAAFPEMERAGAKMIMDITHAVQLPGGQGGSSGGLREAIPYLARAAAAIGVSGFFAETHPDPAKAFSDGPNAWPLEKLEALIGATQAIAEAGDEQARFS